MEIEKISKYREILEKELKTLKDERKEILKKVESGEALSFNENMRNKKIVSQIKEIQNKLEPLTELDFFDEMSENLNIVNNEKITTKEKKLKIKELVASFKKINETNKKNLSNELDLETEDLKELDKVKASAEKELEELKIELRLAKRRNYNTEDIEKDIEDEKKIIEKIENLNSCIPDLAKIEKDLNILANSNDKEEKATIMFTYNSIINEEKEKCTMKIEEAIDNEKIIEKDNLNNSNITSIKNRNKKQLKKSSKSLEETCKKIKGICYTAALCLTIILIAKSCSKNIKNSKVNNINDINELEIEQTYENTNKETIEALVNKGYSEYAAMLMAENFDEATINALQTIPYNSLVENYATEKEFNLDYLNDYENARTTYNLTSDKAIDYVNRSYKIFETSFYEDATINEIVEVVMAIDNKNLFMQENANLAQSFNTSFNRIVDNYLFGTTTEEDLTKLDALQYFAKEGSDLDLFLTEFGTLAKDNVKNPNDKEAKDKMYTYMAEFTLSVNGYTNTDEDINISEPYNTNAQVNDYFDWYMAYNSFIAPLYPTFVDENEFSKYDELQYIMLTALEDPQFEMVCENGQSLTLGGE